METKGLMFPKGSKKKKKRIHKKASYIKETAPVICVSDYIRIIADIRLYMNIMSMEDEIAVYPKQMDLKYIFARSIMNLEKRLRTETTGPCGSCSRTVRENLRKQRAEKHS